MSSTVSENTNDRLGAAPFVIAGLSFIPLIGVLFGVIAVLWGLFTKKNGGKKLAIIGAAGICFTFAIYGTLFYVGFVQRGGIYDDLRQKQAQASINSLVPAIEFYRKEYGSYPESLEVLQSALPKESFVTVYDPASMPPHKTNYFYYERADAEHYYLRGVGLDGVLFTDDDTVPQVPTSGNLGLLTERQPRK
jgi:hypothetical protein